MNFIEAVEAMRMGKAVRRKGWPRNRQIWLERGEYVAYGTTSLIGWELLATDFLGNDWEEVGNDE